VTVLDKETGDIIREVPPQQVLDMVAKLDEMMGILFEQKA
jgi:flagellar protein FlaG